MGAHVILAPNTDVTKDADIDQTKIVDLGPLKGCTGMQDFRIPAAMAANAMGYHTVVLWDTAMKHAIASAPLVLGARCGAVTPGDIGLDAAEAHTASASPPGFRCWPGSHAALRIPARSLWHHHAVQPRRGGPECVSSDGDSVNQAT